MRLSVVVGFTKPEIAAWATRHLIPETIVVSDGLACLKTVTECGVEHEGIVTGGGPQSVTRKAFQWVNTVLGNVKRTYHAVSERHLPRYHAEFYYRFNRRFQLEDEIPSLGYVAARIAPMPTPFLSWLRLGRNQVLL